MRLDLVNILFVLSICELLLIAVFLVTYEKGRRSSDRFLGLFFLAIALNLTDTFLQFNHTYNQFPALAFWGSCLPLAFGPLLLFYVRSLFQANATSNLNWLVHLIPFVTFFLVTETSYILQGRVFQQALLARLGNHTTPEYLPVTASVIFVHFFTYAGFSLQLIRKYQREVSQRFSDPALNNMRSISSAIVCFMTLTVMATVNQWTLLTPYAGYFYGFFSVLLIFTFLFISRVLIKSMQRTDIFSVTEDRSLAVAENSSGMSEGERNEIVKIVRVYMASSKPYRDPDLTLDQLAAQLSLRPKILSQVINGSMHQNFFDFINHYRIEEAQHWLRNSPDAKITVLEVLYKVGFNSKSSFNTLFKKYSGVTPTQYRRREK